MVLSANQPCLSFHSKFIFFAVNCRLFVPKHLTAVKNHSRHCQVPTILSNVGEINCNFHIKTQNVKILYCRSLKLWPGCSSMYLLDVWTLHVTRQAYLVSLFINKWLVASIIVVHSLCYVVPSELITNMFTMLFTLR